MDGDKDSLHTGEMAERRGDPVLGAILKQARQKLGYSQAEVGRLVAMSRGARRPMSAAAVGQWETGQTMPTTQNLIVVCQVLEIDYADATKGKRTPLPSRAKEVNDPSVQEFTIAPDATLLKRSQMPQDIEVFGIAVGGADGAFHFNGEVVDRVRRPPALANTKRAYAIYVSGHSMEPRFDEGDLVYVNPDRPPSIGDYVVIQLVPENGETNGDAYIKKLVRRTADKLICEQFNPKKELSFSTKRVRSVHRIMKWNEVLGT